MPRITGLTTHDVRFPTSTALDGSDAMNPDPDYSLAYVVLESDDPDGHAGHGFTFTIGRGTDLCVAAIELLAPLVVGADTADLGELARGLVRDPQLRWLGPEKGVVHLATAAVVNAAWDLRARCVGLPLWELLSQLSPDEIVGLVDWRHLGDTLTPAAARELLCRAEPGRAERAERLRAHGYPAYTTTPGWLGYDDDKMVRLLTEALRDGFTQVKLKVGHDLGQDVHRMALARETVGPDVRIAVDANQVWEVDEAVSWMRELAPYDPWWIEEPTSPDDVLGHAAIRRALAPIKVATGEHAMNRVLVKQLLAAGAIDVLQIDACRVAGVNENVANLLLAAAFDVPVCPHAGGVGLCEVVQHLAMFDYVAVSGGTDGRMIEFADHLHEHFVTPVRVEGGHYRAPSAPGTGAELAPEALARFRYPDGPAWQAEPDR